MTHSFLPHPSLDMMKPHEIKYISKSQASKQIKGFQFQIDGWMQSGRVTLIANNQSYTGLADPHGTKKGNKMWMWNKNGDDYFGWTCLRISVDDSLESCISADTTSISAAVQSKWVSYSSTKGIIFAAQLNALSLAWPPREAKQVIATITTGSPARWRLKAPIAIFSPEGKGAKNF